MFMFNLKYLNFNFKKKRKKENEKNIHSEKSNNY